MGVHLSFIAQCFRYWEIFLSWLLTHPSRCYKSKEGEKVAAYITPSKALHHFGKNYRKNHGSKGIICRVTSNREDIEWTCQILRAMCQEIKDAALCDWSVGEVLAKVLAYRDLKEGQTLSLPIMDSSGHMSVQPCIVDRVFDLWHKTCAFGIVGSNGNNAPILLFRGTDTSLATEGGRASIVSDFDPRGPGWTLFEKGQKGLRAWLKGRGCAARVIGHSLGGVIASYTLIHEAQWISQKPHESSYAFNFPGVSEKLMNQWNSLHQKPNFTGFVCRGDVVSKLGFLFGNTYELFLKKHLSPIRAHEMLLFAERSLFLQRVDLEQENRSSSRKFYSKVQKKAVLTLYNCGLKFFFK